VTSAWRPIRLALLAVAVATCAPSASTPQPTTSVSPAGASPATTPVASPSARVEAANVALEPVIEDLVAPIGLVAAPGDAERSFVVEQTGRIHVLRGTERAATPFLDLSDELVRLDTEYDERGLLGLAFHPGYASNGRFFVYYSVPASATTAGAVDHTNRLSEFRVSDDPDLADPTSERVVLEFDQPQPNHSGGALGFGPDEFLYLGTGDGGGRGDADEGHSPQGNAQDPSKLNGKVLRLDVDGEEPYVIPPDNPFVGGEGRPEIFADGFRNPWRLAWEPDGDRRFLVSDVGYGRYEEIDAVTSGGNYGWRIREGAHCLDIDAPLDDVTGCPTVAADGRPLIDPIVEYTHREVGIAVVGGYVYRGGDLPDLRGRYVFADFSADWTTNEPDPHGSLLVADPTGTPEGPWPWRRLVVADDPLGQMFVTGMGEDAAGELYVMARHSFGPIGQTGFVFRIVPPVS
jgi:glucose/arabinose dehydrogenase